MIVWGIFATIANAQSGGSWDYVPTITVVNTVGDARPELFDEAVIFWNKTLAEIGNCFCGVSCGTLEQYVMPIWHRRLEAPMELFDNLVQEFNGALDRAVEAHKNKASRAAADEVHYADDLYETIAEEMRLQGLREPIQGIPRLAELYTRLKAVESVVIPVEK